MMCDFTAALCSYTCNPQPNATGSRPSPGASSFYSGRHWKRDVVQHQGLIPVEVSRHFDTVQCNRRISHSERTVTRGKLASLRETRSLLKSERFSSVSVYSWNFNLLHSSLRLGCRMPPTHTHTLTHVYTLSWADPATCIMHTHAGKLTSKLTSKFFFTCHLVLVSSFSSLPLCTPSSPLPTTFASLTTFVIKRSTALDTSVPSWPQSVYCFLPLSPLFLPSLLQSSNQCCAVRSASSISLPLRTLMPFPITPASFTLSLHPPPLPSLSLSDKAINSTLHAYFTPSNSLSPCPFLSLPQYLPQHLFVLKKQWKQPFCAELIHL